MSPIADMEMQEITRHRRARGKKQDADSDETRVRDSLEEMRDWKAQELT